MNDKEKKAFYYLVRDSGMPPEKVLQLKIGDIDLVSHTIKIDYPGCELCQKIFPKDREIWFIHIRSESHIAKVSDSIQKWASH